MQRVLVLSRDRKPLMPCHPARARELLRKGRAAVYRRYPFTIILKDREDGEVQDVRLKVDPGSRRTGLALVASFKRGRRVVWAAEIEHRGERIRQALEKRRAVRRSRRSRKTRYRKPRFLNRRRKEGWLPPSLASRVANVVTWARRLARWCPVNGLSLELVKFDTQKLENPEVRGVEYQRGELFGYEVREYLLEKWGRRCAYCGRTGVPLEVEHIVPRSRGGTDRVSNLTLACRECNLRKGNLTAAEFGYPEVQAKAKKPLRDVAVVNSTRWRLYEELRKLGLPVECGTGGRTKYNRVKQGYPKAHWVDAACVGESGEKVYIPGDLRSLVIEAVGWGTRQVCRMDRYGFPRTSAKRSKVVRGFRTGDLVRAEVPRGKKAGVYEGRVAVRASGSFNVRTARGVVQGSRGGTAGFCKRPTVTATVQALLCYRQASKGGSSPWLKPGVSAPKGEKDDTS